ncbi:MAG: GntR family transcriptional regulator [Bacillota bacterium]
MNVKLDRSSYIPLYIQVKEMIKDKIEAGNYSQGERVPSETELQNELSISRTTARNALKELVNEGILETHQGKGTFVCKEKLSHPLPNLTSFTEDIKNKGLKPGSEVIENKLLNPDEFVKEQLDLENTDKVYLLKRLRTIDGEAVGLHEAYINAQLLEELEASKFTEIDFEKNSLYQIFENEYGIKIGEAEETIEASPADSNISNMLNIPESFPVLILNRQTYTEDGKPLEYVKIIYRADRYRYHVKLKRK